MWIGGNEVFRTAMQVGEIAAPTAGDQYLFADSFGALQYGHASPATARFHRAHEPGCARAQNDHIVSMKGRIIQTSDYPSFGVIFLPLIISDSRSYHSDSPSCHSDSPSCHSERSEESAFAFPRLPITPREESGLSLLSFQLPLLSFRNAVRNLLFLPPACHQCELYSRPFVA
jgi:hypothetical protein